MKVAGPIAALVVMTCLAYTCVGQLVPQKDQPPPPSAGENATPAELAKIGKETYGISCTACHGAIGSGGTERAPGLDGVAARAIDRAKERAGETGQPYSASDYLAESLTDPGSYLAKRESGAPYGNIMMFKLSPIQTLAVLAYLESLGGNPSTDANSEVWKRWGTPITAEDEGQSTAAPAGPIPQGTPEEMILQYGCDVCHDLQGKLTRGGPPLSDIGARMSRGDIFTQILVPDSEIAKGPPGVVFPKGVMGPALEGNGFYSDVGREDLYRLANWLAEKKGGAN